nr:hypothetical protein RVX_2111 [Nitratidesulfovibrio sp. HK-II]
MATARHVGNGCSNPPHGPSPSEKARQPLPSPCRNACTCRALPVTGPAAQPELPTICRGAAERN